MTVWDQFTLEVLRLLRITLAILAVTRGMSGLMLQNVLKNPIASLDIIGITGGASLSAVVFIAFFSHLTYRFTSTIRSIRWRSCNDDTISVSNERTDMPDNTHNHRYFDAKRCLLRLSKDYSLQRSNYLLPKLIHG